MRDRRYGEWIGPYQLGEKIGYGSFAEVYRSTAPGGRMVAVKVAREKGGRSSMTVGITFPAEAEHVWPGDVTSHEFSAAEVGLVFQAEAKALQAEGGRVLPRLIDWQSYEGRPVLVLELLETPWRVETAEPRDFVRLLDALAAMESHGVTPHGDVKPEHVFQRPDGQLVVIDPGFDGSAQNLRTITPEFNPWRVSGVAADVCAVAVMLYRRYAGAFPPVTPWLTADLNVAQPRLSDVSPAPKAVGEWVDSILRPGGFTGTDAWTRWPAWAHDYGDASRALQAACERPIVESGVFALQALPRLASRISADMPPGWFIKESWTMLHPSGQANIIISREPLDVSINVEKYAEVQGTLLEREFPAFRQDSFTEVTFLGGQRGYLREFSWSPPDGVSVSQLQTYFVMDGTGFTATATTPTTSIAQFKAGFMSVLLSLEFGS